jgi:hypothetical protein
VFLCHRTPSGRIVTIKVSIRALVSHIRHGDLSGRCTPAKIKKLKKHRG